MATVLFALGTILLDTILGRLVDHPRNSAMNQTPVIARETGNLIMDKEAIERIWLRCERVARRGFYERVWRRGFVLGTLLTHLLWTVVAYLLWV